jgi:hypothetical protein
LSIFWDLDQNAFENASKNFWLKQKPPVSNFKQYVLSIMICNPLNFDPEAFLIFHFLRLFPYFSRATERRMKELAPPPKRALKPDQNLISQVRAEKTLG